jgi:hypothetical protein
LGTLKGSQILRSSGENNIGVTVTEDVAGIFRMDLPIKAAISLFMGTFNKAPFILPMIQDPTSFTLC